MESKRDVDNGLNTNQPGNNRQSQNYGNSNKKIFIWLPLCIAVSIAIGIFIGNSYARFNSGHGWFGNGKNNKLETVLEYIDKSYVDTVNVNALVENAIPAVVAGLDPHSSYLSAETMARRNEELEGHFSGIGVEFILIDDTLTVIKPIAGGPSEAVGIKAGDRIVYVNDSLFVGKDINENKVYTKLRGPSGSKLKLAVKRRGVDELIPFEVTRGDVPVNSVEAAYTLDGGVGYIKVRNFGSNTFNEFITAIARLKSQGADSFIIDLQQNSGGYMEAAIRMVNEFLSSGTMIVYTEGRAYPRENYVADKNGSCKDDDIAVLIDEGSGSASEIFAGAIQDNDRGLIVGRRSFGKGLVQAPFKFKDGSELRLTIARYHTPSERCIQKAYETGNYEDYGMDIYNRFTRGEFYSRDSIKMDNFPIFYTAGGRTVYGDDGIMSDVFVPRDTTGITSYYIRVADKGLLREYAYVYTERNRERLERFDTWSDAAEYLSNQSLVYSFADYAYSRGIRKQPYLIEQSRRLIQNQLEALIVRNIFGEDGFYQLYQRDDKMILTAAEMIRKGKASPEAVTNEEYK